MNKLSILIAILFATYQAQAAPVCIKHAKAIIQEILDQTAIDQGTKDMIQEAALAQAATKNSKGVSCYHETKLRNTVLSMILPPVATNTTATSSTTSGTMQQANEPSYHELIINQHRNTHLIPHAIDPTTGKRVANKQYEESIVLEPFTIKLIQAQGCLQGNLGKNGNAACGPLSIFHALQLINYCTTGNAQYLINLNNNEYAQQFLTAADAIQNAEEVELNALFLRPAIQHFFHKPTPNYQHLFGYINSNIVPGALKDNQLEKTYGEEGNLTITDYFTLSESIKQAIHRFRSEEYMIYGVILADIEPSKEGHYYCIVINKLNAHTAQFILIDSGRVNHLENPKKRNIIEGLVYLFTTYPDNLL
ncbi:MAG: hypothetical protein WD068_00180 [Candidatus Babeliales bacterium]